VDIDRRQRHAGVFATLLRSVRPLSIAGRLAVALAVGGLAAGAQGAVAQAASWHLDSSFGKRGVAGLPVRERDAGSLLTAGPQGSVFVGGYADRKKGAFLVARLSVSGRLVKSFGGGGVSTVPTVYAFPQDPPRMFALAGGRLLIVGLSRSDHFTVVRLTARGRPDRAFGHNGVAQYTLPDVHGFTVITAATVEPDGDILAVYQREVPQLVNEPRIPAGLGEGQIALVRLLPSGALDRSFGKGGFLDAPGETPALGGYPGSGVGWACEQTIAPDGSLLLAYEQAFVPNDDGAENPAVQELGPTGADASGYGEHGASYLPFVPKTKEASSSLCDGLFARPGGAVEAAFGGEGQDSTMIDLFRFTPTGAPDPTFGTSGHTTLDTPVAALALAPAGETFSAGTSGSALVVGGTLASGAPDPALGGGRGERFAVNLPGGGANGQPSLELLPGNDSLSVRVGEDIVRVSR
jgi:uncharacterized delta-60 repeat protein